MRALKASALGALMAMVATAASAAGYRTVDWPDLQKRIYGEREVTPAGAAVTLTAPRRTPDDRRAPIDVSVRLVDGSTIKSISIIIDENPMPVSAVVEMATRRDAFAFSADMRMNGPSPVRAIVETDDGRLLMAETLVKTSGLGACAAPPMGDPDAAIAAIGEMQATEIGALHAGSGPRRVRVEMKHPQHTGMQMDQITLHYILARYVDAVDVWAGEEKLFTLTGSISLSEDPGFEFDFQNDAADTVRVRLTDTEETVVDKVLPLRPAT